MNKSGDYGVSGSAHPACNTRPVHTDGRVEDGRGSLALPSHRTGLPRLPEPPFQRAVPTTPADRAGSSCRLLPRSRGLPQMAGGSASALSLSRPAQASLMLRPTESLSRAAATFVTRLQPVQLPARAARQLPDQSTTLRMDSSSADDSRLRGALAGADITRELKLPVFA
jgi:hypothetical protein